jgi:hypothetical protein
MVVVKEILRERLLCRKGTITEAQIRKAARIEGRLQFKERSDIHDWFQ